MISFALPIQNAHRVVKTNHSYKLFIISQSILAGGKDE